MVNQLLLAVFVVSALFIPMQTNAQNQSSNRYFHLLTGTYTSGKSEGIYVYRFDSETGELTHEYTQKNVENPSFLAVSPDGNHVYAVKEVSGEKEGMVNAFRFNAENGKLEFINQQPSGGGDPCYLTVDKKGRHLFAGNYTGGSLSVIPIAENGALETPAQTIQHKGKSINPERQEKAHVHSTVLSPDEEHLFTGDLGVDKIFIYKYNPGNPSQPLQAARTPFTSVKPGTGPRHLIFDKTGNFAYLIQELTAEVSVFAHKDGNLKHLQTASLVDKNFKGEVSAAEIKISPDGNFLYASNRGDANEISVFRIDQKKGTLNLEERQPSLGKTPRNFIIDPTGNFLLVAHQDSDSIVIFKRNKSTGKITPTGRSIEVGNPVYLTMIPATN